MLTTGVSLNWENCPNRLKHVVINVYNKNIVVSNGDTLHIVKGDIIKIVYAWATNHSQSGFRINCYGLRVGNSAIRSLTMQKQGLSDLYK